jgi:hypothetical protein
VRSPLVYAWWALMSSIAVLNIVLWSRVRVRAQREIAADAPGNGPRRMHLALSGIYVFVCAFRSFLPRADVQKICLVNSWFSTVFVGRSVATVAEVCFVAQWAVFLREVGVSTGDRTAQVLSRVLVPLICVAETCSWYAVLSTNYLGNTCEESIWTLTATLTLIGMLSARRHAPPVLRRLLGIGSAIACGYVAFMCFVDVRMYFTRWRADVATGRAFLSIGEGLHVLLTRWYVTFRFEDWRTEMPWMTLYFSVAVWISIYLLRLAPLRSLDGDRKN